MTGEDWAEKYRPKTLSEVVGNPGAAEQIRKWAEQWVNGKPAMRAVTVTGPPGIGKTSAAEALARDMGWDILEMNASDQRNADAIRSVAVKGSQYSSFGADGSFLSTADGKMKLIVLDEADCLYGNADRGAMPVINELIKTTDQPLMLIANDGYALNRKSSVVKDQTLQIAFRRPTAASIAKVVRKVCAAEGVEIEDGAVVKIAENASGDIRAALRDLQSLASAKKTVTAQDAEVLSGREDRSEMFDVVGAIYRRRDPELARKAFLQADTDPDTLLLWLSDNMPYECHSAGDLVRVSERLARADVYLGRVKRRMLYGFRGYAIDMMVQGVPEALRSNEVTRDRLRFPTYLVRMSRTKGSRTLRASASAKIGAYMHTSGSRVVSDLLPQIRVQLQSDPEMRKFYAREVELEPEELAFILGVTPDKKIVKECYAEEKPPKAPKEPKSKAKKPKEPAPEPPKAPEPPPAPKPEPEPVPEPPKAPEQPAKQKSLFDF